MLDFLDIDWNATLELGQKKVDVSFQNFFDKMKHFTDKYAPLRKLTRKQIKTLTKPWITKGIQVVIHKRNKLQKLFKNTKDPTLKKLHELEYKKYRNLIVSLTRKSKKNHFISYIHENIFNLKKVWQGINSIIPNIVVCPQFMLIIIVISPQIPLLYPINLMIIFPMLQTLQEPKFLILRNISRSFHFFHRLFSYQLMSLLDDQYCHKLQ